ncbi:MerR family transcriptional regulator [Corynebacterium sp. zg-331]|uniref:MerR family transcriptional regulator n=1 Tax=unclassified Corynebacterium TaxID=2624378 RepID=UPI00128D760E|nr:MULTISPECIES: MerR family transcriptional regulator [unclassified Corynebacterium]MBC3185650.1 MerR family transcriptional regulator [Corynebacterium sp. zg-331]MPV52144.1 MerR family DNA-binding transcriptional regulator [Corynebacterium sp. zg331]
MAVSENNTDDYTIGQAAEILGVTPRTLRHWESVGLLEPRWRTLSEYRLYTEGDLERGLQILVYREAGVPLAQIGELIDTPGTCRERLQRQREVLVAKIARLRGMIRAVDEILEGETIMSVEEQARSWAQYRAEAQERWGDTPEWEQSRERMKEMTAGDWEEAAAEAAAFREALAEAAERGVAPGSPEADGLALRHRAEIGRWYEVTPSKQVLLARMYVADDRFAEAYGQYRDYLRDLVEARAEKEGVNLDDVRWC